MSRRYPIERAFVDEPPIPWPWLTKRAAAKALGVDADFLSGLANNGIRSCTRRGKTGQPVTLFCKEDVQALVERTRGAS